MTKIFILILMVTFFINLTDATDNINSTLKKEENVISSSDVMAKIKNGECIFYKNKILKGDLDFGQLDHTQTDGVNKTYFPYNITITDSKIEGSLSAIDITFLGQINFANTTFLGDLSFEDCEFDNEVELSHANFKSIVSFFQSSFTNIFTCRSSLLTSANFDGANFSGLVDFSKSNFYEASFRGTKFLNQPNFFESKFEGETGFEGAEFYSPYFLNVKFFGDAFFNDAKFYNQAVFEGSIFNENVDFSYARFNSPTNFKKSQFNNNAFFRNTIFEDVYFDDSFFINKAFFEDAVFNTSISLNQAHYERLYARWDGLENRLKYNDEVYLSLIANYKSLGWFEDFNNCYYRYRIEYGRRTYDLSIPSGRELRSNPRHYFSMWYSFFINLVFRVFEYLFMVINGYGVKPFRPLWLMCIIVPAFGIFYLKADNISFWRAMKFSLIVFLSGSGKLFVQAPEYKPKSCSHLASLSIIIFYLERVIGMVLFVALLVAFSRTILR